MYFRVIFVGFPLALLFVGELWGDQPAGQRPAISAEASEDPSTPPRQSLTRDAEEFFDSRQSRTVAWIHVHRWFERGEFENIARAFEKVDHRDHWLGEYAQILHSRGKHSGLQEYFKAHHPSLHAFSARLAEMDRKSAMIRWVTTLSAARPEENSLLMGIVGDENEDLRLRMNALHVLISTTPGEQRVNLAVELYPTWVSGPLARAATNFLYRTEDPAVRHYLKERLTTGALGHEHIAIVPIGDVANLDVSVQWLSSCLAEAEAPSVRSLIQAMLTRAEKLNRLPSPVESAQEVRDE